MLKSLVLSVALVIPALALADACPNAQTAPQGFVLERHGTKAEVRRVSDHFVHVTNLYPGGKKQDVIYYKGLLPISRFDATTQSLSIPVSDVRTIFPLALKDRRAVTFAPATPSSVSALVSLELTVTGLEEIELGSCTYEVFAVHHRYMNTEGRTTSEHTDLYSAALGFVLAKRYPEKGGKHTLVQYQSIRPLGRAPF